MLDWTGERYLPFLGPEQIGAEIHYEHLHRYAFASQLVKGKKVLDLASGEGYGSYLLSKEARDVIGIDIDRGALKHSHETYDADNLQFVQGTILDAPLKEGFDIVICFEALEHIDDPEKLISEVKRLLRKDGLFIVSTPNKKTYSDEPGYKNPFHVKELYFEDLEELLRRYFSHIIFFGQKVYSGSTIWSLSSQQTAEYSEFLIDRDEETFAFKNNSAKIPLYYIAVASNSPMQGLKNESYLVDISNTLPLLLAKRIQRFEVESSRMGQEIASLNEQIQQLVELANGLRAKLNLTLIRAHEAENRARGAERRAYAAETEIEEMRKSIAWRAIMKYHEGFVERILPMGTGRRNYYHAAIDAARNVVGGETDYLQWKIKGRLKAVGKSSSEMQPVTIDKKISVVIPTKNAGRDFEFTLQRLKDQKGIRETEIIIADSGSSDSTIDIARGYSAKVLSISPGEYHHGVTRNLAAEKADGDYILFLVQDAIPIGDEIVKNMAKKLAEDPEIAAVTCRQIPRSDADLFACFALWNHYRHMDFIEDRISVYPEKQGDIKPLQRRKLAGLEDVCCMVRRDVFQKYLFRKDFAEDLDLGLRLLEGKYKLAFLYSEGVVHSHNRSSDYFLKRYYVDSKALRDLLELDDVKGYDKDIRSLMKGAVSIYAALDVFCIMDRNMSFDCIGLVFTELKRMIKDAYLGTGEKPSMHYEGDSLGKMLEDLQELIEDGEVDPDPEFIDYYFALLDSFKGYADVYGSLEHKRDEFHSALYKLLAAAAGSELSRFVYFASSQSCGNAKLNSLDRILTEGI